MIPVFLSVLQTLRTWAHSRAAPQLEILALRHHHEHHRQRPRRRRLDGLHRWSPDIRRFERGGLPQRLLGWHDMVRAEEGA
jgi:hypothetical protein